jgi:hypothetical protein
VAKKKNQNTEPSEEKDAIAQAEQEAADAEVKAEETATEQTAEEAPAAEETAEETAEEAAEEAADAEESAEEAAADGSVEQAASEVAASEELVAPIEEPVAEPDGSALAPTPAATSGDGEEPIKGIAAYFDLPDDLMAAAAYARESKYEKFDAYSPFPIHGMDDAMGLGRSWIPWVTFGAGSGGFLTANALQFGTMSFDWPMIIGGKPFAPWPSFVPIMFELTVLLAGVTTGLVMLIAAGCFRKPFIIDREITNDRFVLWISADDDNFDPSEVQAFMESLNPVEIRTITKGA